MTLPATPRISLRDAIIWIAYREAQPPHDFIGDKLWLSREKEIEDACKALWSTLEDGNLEASAIGSDGAPTIIGKHEWQFLFGRSMISFAMTRGGKDALYVNDGFAQAGILAASSLRFRNVTVPRMSVLETWPRRSMPTKGVGRPSIMDEIEAELDRWVGGGFQLISSEMKKHEQGGKTTMIAICRALEHWAIQRRLKNGPGDEPQAKAIENKLRDKLRIALELL